MRASTHPTFLRTIRRARHQRMLNAIHRGRHQRILHPIHRVGHSEHVRGRNLDSPCRDLRLILITHDVMFLLPVDLFDSAGQASFPRTGSFIAKAKTPGNKAFSIAVDDAIDNVV